MINVVVWRMVVSRNLQKTILRSWRKMWLHFQTCYCGGEGVLLNCLTYFLSQTAACFFCCWWKCALGNYSPHWIL